jgi:hypothetical protein
MIGPFCRPLLEEAGIPTSYLEGINAGTLEWDVRPEPAVAVSCDLDAARAIVRAAEERKDFLVEIRRAAREVADGDDEDVVYEIAIPSALGQRLADARRYEEGFAARGTAHATRDATAFPPGTPEDWISPTATSWGAMAFEFRRAAETVAKAHAPTEPAPLMALLTLCRHHLELALKTAIDAARPVPPTHDLRQLWELAQPVMRESAGDRWDAAEAGHLELVLGEFEQVDPDGQAARYPTSRKGTPFARPQSMFACSLTGFMENFSRVANFLSLNLLWVEVRRRVRERDQRK